MFRTARIQHGRGVRLDVYIGDGSGRVFDLEMQSHSRKNLPKRARYYQSMIDVDHLTKGASYDELPKTYVIFICTFDPLGGDMHKYEFRELCTEDPSIELPSGLRKVFINAKGSRPWEVAYLKKILREC